VHPVRDVFAAVFFVSAGMLIDPSVLVEHAGAIALLSGLVIVGKIVGTTAGSFLAGYDVCTSVSAGMSLAQIGELSFIIAGVGLSSHTAPASLYAIAVAVSAVTTLTTPWLIRGSGRVAAWVDGHLPAPLATVATLYGTWLEGLRTRRTPARRIRRLIALLLVDAACLGGIVIGAAWAAGRLGPWLSAHAGLPPWAPVLVIGGAAAVLALPFCVGIFRVARALGLLIGAAALPASRVDLAQAPRRTLVITLQLAFVLVVAMPLLAVTQPFVGTPVGAAVLALLLVLYGVLFWRSAVELHGHVRAGAEVVLEALLQGAAEPRPELPGLGAPVRIELAANSPAVGRTLAELELRTRTGAVVLARARRGEGIVIPTGSERLAAGDVLALAGTAEAVAAARRLLSGEARPPD
jgi:CPA2 family monovalent cation:H+ antiporter-2